MFCLFVINMHVKTIVTSSHGGDVKTILAPALLALFLGGCMPVEAVGRVLMIAGEAGKTRRPARPQSDIEMVRCTMKDGSVVLTAAQRCDGPRSVP